MLSAGLKQGSIQHHTNPGPRVVPPVPRQWVRKRLRRDGIWIGCLLLQQLLQHLEQFSHVLAATFSQQRRQTVGEPEINRTEAIKGRVLIFRPGQHDQLSVLCLSLPDLQLIEAITPVPSAAEQSHENDVCA